MRTLAAIVMLAGFGVGIATAEPVPLPTPRPPIAKPPRPPVWAPRPDWHDPVSFRDAAGTDFKTEETTSEPSACRLRLEKVASIEAMPRLIGPGACGGGDIVRLDGVLLASGKRIEIKPASYLRCPMAEQLALWVRDDTAPQVAATGAELIAVETADNFDCRGRNRKSSGKISEHGKANAVDVRGLAFADGGFAKLTDIHVPKALREGIRKSACDRFTTVLGPGSDGYHEEHIHLDLAERHNGYRICQWDVREPPPAKAPEPPEVSAVAPAAAAAASPPLAKIPPAAAPEAPRVQLAIIDVPLPPTRPTQLSRSQVNGGQVGRGHVGKVHHRRKTRGGVHFPFNLFQ